MGRAQRNDPAGAWHHVMSRGVDRQAIFFDIDDRRTFGELLGETVTAIRHRGPCVLPDDQPLSSAREVPSGRLVRQHAMAPVDVRDPHESSVGTGRPLFRWSIRLTYRHRHRLPRQRRALHPSQPPGNRRNRPRPRTIAGRATAPTSNSDRLLNGSKRAPWRAGSPTQAHSTASSAHRSPPGRVRRSARSTLTISSTRSTSC